jgi:hypothetical protein
LLVFQLVLIVIKFWVTQDFNKENYTLKKILFICGALVEPSPLLLLPLIALLYEHRMTDSDDCRAISEMSNWQEKP